MTSQIFASNRIELAIFKTKLAPAIIAVAFLLSGCAFLRPTSPVLHTADCNLDPVLGLRLPEHVNTLTRIPRTKVIAENGINKNTGDPQTDGIKEFFYLERGNVEYEFDLCFDATAAIKLYESQKHRHPVLRETTVDERNACLHYTEQPRTDPEGGSLPMSEYISRATFRLHNMMICVTAEDDESRSDKLANAVKDLAQMLDGAFSGEQ